MSGYSDREIPLVPSALHGVRGFTVHSDGKLAPLHRGRDIRYTSGEHTAECRFSGQVRISYGHSTVMLVPLYNEMSVHDDPAPQLECSCGFYAYFDQPETTTSFLDGVYGQHVNGIVRATGRVIVGSEGFRAEKIQIVGLVTDPPKARNLRERFHVVMRDLVMFTANFPQFKWLGFLAMHFSFLGLDYFFDNELTDFLWHSTALIVYAMLMIVLVIFGYTIFVGPKILSAQEGVPPRDVTNKIKKNYPELQFFSSLDEAKKHFNVTRVHDLPR